MYDSSQIFHFDPDSSEILSPALIYLSLSLALACSLSLSLSQGHKNTNVPLKSPGEFFLSGAKHLMGHFEGFFEGAETLLTPEWP
jgi:hypothetical protein